MTTVKELRAEIYKLRTQTLNPKLLEYRQSGESVAIFDKAIDLTIKKSGAKGFSRGGGLPTGYNLNKAGLEAYKRELQRLETYDMFTPAAIQREEYQQKKAMNSFMKNHPEFSEGDYDVMSKAFASLSDAQVEIFTSDEVAEVAKQARKKNLKGDTLAKIIDQKIREGEKRNLSQEEIQLAVIRSIKYGRSGR